jgi:hypothetical protein
MFISDDVFANNPGQLYWQIEFTVSTISTANGIATGSSSIIVKLNQLPKGGTCSISPSTGTILTTKFSLSCSNWADTDGYITSYAFFGKNKYLINLNLTQQTLKYV